MSIETVVTTEKKSSIKKRKNVKVQMADTQEPEIKKLSPVHGEIISRKRNDIIERVPVNELTDNELKNSYIFFEFRLNNLRHLLDKYSNLYEITMQEMEFRNIKV